MSLENKSGENVNSNTTQQADSNAMDSNRVTDTNGWIEIKDNPISKVGIYQYSGASIGGDPNRIYNVYRPEAELSDPECINSFKLLPWVNEHVMLGEKDRGLTPAEEKGIEGVVGEDVYFKDGTLYANIKVFSENLSELIEAGKKQLSAGYRCIYEMISGIYDGVQYDAIQRNIRGNHLALVHEGRMGREVAVQDHLDHFNFTFDSKEIIKMSEENKKEEEKKEGMDARMSKALDWIEKKMEDEAEESKKKEAKEDAKDGVEPDVEGLDGEEEKEKESKKEDKKEGMDHALLTKNIFVEIEKRNVLANKLSKYLGTFDHSDKTLAEVAKYGVEKLGISCPKGSETVALDGYFHNRPSETKVFGLDSKNDNKTSLLAKTINKGV